MITVKCPNDDARNVQSKLLEYKGHKPHYYCDHEFGHQWKIHWIGDLFSEFHTFIVRDWHDIVPVWNKFVISQFTLWQWLKWRLG